MSLKFSKFSNNVSRPKVLIVEDNEILAEYFADVFSRDFDVKSAFSAEQAIVEVGDFAPDLIWLDILLGEHSAFAFLNELRTCADTLRTPVVICSDMTENLGEELLREYGVVRIFDKSKMRPGEILRTAKEILNETN